MKRSLRRKPPRKTWPAGPKISAKAGSFQITPGSVVPAEGELSGEMPRRARISVMLLQWASRMASKPTI